MLHLDRQLFVLHVNIKEHLGIFLAVVIESIPRIEHGNLKFAEVQRVGMTLVKSLF